MRSPTTRIASERSAKRCAKRCPSATTSKCVKSSRRNGVGTPTCSVCKSGGKGESSSLANLLPDSAKEVGSESCPATTIVRKSSSPACQCSRQRRACARWRAGRIPVSLSVAHLALRPRPIAANGLDMRRVGPRRYSSTAFNSAQDSRNTFVATSPACQSCGTTLSLSISPRRRSIASRTVGNGFRHQL